ncbi:MAG: ClpXP protease specificity-enhancing factor SspB [Mariprofundaceae bacterium]|nr:ClpXP protease specificity-enhancing factor SspB [Mariprofundaceae bacterium]
MAEINFARATKVRKLRRYFEQQGRIYIVVDATRQDVILPEHLKGDPAVNLVLNMRMPQRIEIGDDAVRSRFSFGGQSTDCEIPLDAIWASYVPGTNMEDGIVWKESVPEVVRTVMDMLEAQHDEDEDEAASPPLIEDEERAKTGRPQLRIVK